MKIEYEHKDTDNHFYRGTSFAKTEIDTCFPNDVRNILKDEKGTQDLVSEFESSLKLTGFDTKNELINILSADVPVSDWRIGEAFAEFYLQQNTGVRFYWSELNDQRNFDANKTGADLVGFIDIKGMTVFLFGEVKTSDDAATPPNVLYGRTGMIQQLEDIAKIKRKRDTLMRYLATKAKLYAPTDNFRIDFEAALSNYIKKNTNYALTGILVRDTKPNERDLKARYESLIKKLKKIAGFQLEALYIPITKDKWKKLVEGK